MKSRKLKMKRIYRIIFATTVFIGVGTPALYHSLHPTTAQAIVDFKYHPIARIVGGLILPVAAAVWIYFRPFKVWQKLIEDWENEKNKK
jgi:hypothetical protein